MYCICKTWSNSWKTFKSTGCHKAFGGRLAWLICDGKDYNVNRPMSLQQYMLCWSLVLGFHLENMFLLVQLCVCIILIWSHILYVCIKAPLLQIRWRDAASKLSVLLKGSRLLISLDQLKWVEEIGAHLNTSAKNDKIKAQSWQVILDMISLFVSIVQIKWPQPQPELRSILNLMRRDILKDPAAIC